VEPDPRVDLPVEFVVDVPRDPLRTDPELLVVPSVDPTAGAAPPPEVPPVTTLPVAVGISLVTAEPDVEPGRSPPLE